MSIEGYDPKAIYSRLYNKSFDLAASGYPKLALTFNTWLYRNFSRALINLLRDCGIEIRGARVLELACGSGYFTESFRRMEPAALTGVDLAPESVERLSEWHKSYTFVEADITDPGLDLPGKPFDFASAFNVVFHILDDKKFKQAIINMGRHLDKGGWAIINDSLPPTSTGPRGHVRFRSLDMFEEALMEAGLEILELRLIQYWGAEPVGDPEDPAVKKADREWSRLSRQAWKSEFRGWLAGSIFYLMNYSRKVSDPLSLPFSKFILARKT
jgi:SAM-dependent methyltransferase